MAKLHHQLGQLCLTVQLPCKKENAASTKLSRSVSYETIKDRNMRKLILDSCPLYTQIEILGRALQLSMKHTKNNQQPARY